MKKALIIVGIIILAIILTVAAIVVAVNVTLGNAAKLQTYDFGVDKIPSLNSVVGDRKVTSAGSSTNSNGVQTKNYTYESATYSEDWLAYHYALQAEGVPITKSREGNDFNGSIQYCYISADEGKIILVDLSWESNRVSLVLTKTPGTYTPN